MPDLVYRSFKRVAYEFLRSVLKEAWSIECRQCGVRAGAYCLGSGIKELPMHGKRLYDGFDRAYRRSI